MKNMSNDKIEIDTKALKTSTLFDLMNDNKFLEGTFGLKETLTDEFWNRYPMYLIMEMATKIDRIERELIRRGVLEPEKP